MNQCLRKAILIIIGSLLGTMLFAQKLPETPIFEDDDRIVFLGNSITQGGYYHTFVELFYLTRFPDRKMYMANSGIAGNQAYHGIARFEEDVLVHDPDIIVMMFGMNDAGMTPDPDKSEEENQAKLKERIATYRTNMDSLTNIILGEGIELIYIAPSIYDDKAKLDRKIRYGGNQAIAMCREVVYELAQKYECPVVDFFTIMNGVNERFQADDPAFTVVGADRVHPGIDGHLLMAYQFLMAQQVPGVVSYAGVDAGAMQVVKQQNCTVSHLNKSGDLLFFAVKANALPFPVLGNEALNWVDFQEDLNQEILQVTGLEAGRYRLTIEGKEIGIFPHDSLGLGINLANHDQTPQYQQALRMKEIALNRQALIRSKLRAMALLDFGALEKLPKDAPIEEKKAVFAELLESIKAADYYPYIKLQTENYLIYDPIKQETEAVIAQYKQALQLLNQPLTLKYELEKVE